MKLSCSACPVETIIDQFDLSGINFFLEMLAEKRLEITLCFLNSSEGAIAFTRQPSAEA